MDMDDLDDVEDFDRYSTDRVTLLEIRVSRLEEEKRSTAVNRVAEAFEPAVLEPWQFPRGNRALSGRRPTEAPVAAPDDRGALPRGA